MIQKLFTLATHVYEVDTTGLTGPSLKVCYTELFQLLLKIVVLLKQLLETTQLVMWLD